MASLFTSAFRVMSGVRTLPPMDTPWAMKVSTRLLLMATAAPAFTAPMPAAMPAAALAAVLFTWVSTRMSATSRREPAPSTEARVLPSNTVTATLAETPAMPPPRPRVAATMC